ncbi:MAG: DUF3795 domain-containing protein, partial [Armatimonadetes bacterium]|nr:DUF3795 domain-containing protein [Armatimonadota bacterium]NIO96995.1 DUF3795 domain-containing protein [Armatimonadota bacterium]
MNYEEEKKRYISFCGSYCHTCDWFTGKIRRTFSSSSAMLEQYGLNRFLAGKVHEGDFGTGLQMLAKSAICSGCKAEVAKDPQEDRCGIRQCCYGQGLDLCVECAEFPCELLKTNTGVIRFHCIDNLMEIEEKGLQHWIDK